MDKRSRASVKGAIYMGLAALLFSFGGLLVKTLPWNAFSINGFRCFFAALVFGLFLKLSKHKLVFNFPVLLGALCVFLTSILFTNATKLTSAANAIIIQYSCPVFVILLSLLIYKKKPAKEDLIAAACVFLGILWFFFSDIGQGKLLGNLLALCGAVCCGGMYMVNAPAKADPQTSILLGMILSAVLGVPFLLQETVFTPQVLGIAVFMGTIQFGLAYILFYFGLHYCTPLAASLLGSLEPILNPLWVALFYGEMMRLSALPGALLVLVTLILYNYGKLRNPPLSAEIAKG